MNVMNYVVDKNELPYWMALAHLRGMETKDKMEIVVQCYNNDKCLSDFFKAEDAEKENSYGLSPKFINAINASFSTIPNYAFMAESLLEQGYEITTVRDSIYPKALKHHLKYKSPLILYTKGNKDLLSKEATAIVGSRKVGAKALSFTDYISRKECSEGKVIVSGFAKGVDRQALDSALACNGSSIVVLPQGITTFISGFKQLYKYVIGGQVLILSYFPPNAGWSKELAMARNSVVYALADKIYVAESSDKGGTWSGVLDGLKRQRKEGEEISIYVRVPEESEKNANKDLITAGAKAVDAKGKEVKAENVVEGLEQIKNQTLSLLSNRSLRPIEIVSKLHLDWSVDKAKRFLDSLLGKGLSKQRQGRYNVYTASLNDNSLFSTL